ncbi:MAG TPA: hypothetical protein VEJ23_03900 [Solirubrobacteraceae bacterium]|nr:hypothetical protein [Solirubrobacteraceae bacterium]
MTDERFDAAELLARTRGLSGGAELLELAAARDDVELVGGAVRDLMLDRAPRELDVVVGEGAGAFAGQLAARLQATALASEHERFGTALVTWPGGRIDIATRRDERYPAPGALPEVGRGTPEQDLARRDFTVNAIAVALGATHRGRARAVAHAREDVSRGVLRVLHDKSFRDDPTRLLRLARYRARLGFEVAPATGELARAAVAAHALDTVSGARAGAELRLALTEEQPLAALSAIDDLGLLTALHPRLRLDPDLSARALALLPGDGRPDLLLLASVGMALVLRAGGNRGAELGALLDRLEFPAGDRDRAVAASLAGASLAEALGGVQSASELHAVVGGSPPEGVALAGAQANPGIARRWLEQVRHVRLRIDGSDLLAAGIPQGPDIGRRLDSVLRARLDERVPDERGAQLRAALERS